VKMKAVMLGACFLIVSTIREIYNYFHVCYIYTCRILCTLSESRITTEDDDINIAQLGLILHSFELIMCSSFLLEF